MKKLVLIILCLGVCLLFVGCQSNAAGAGGQTEGTAASDVSSAFQTPPTTSGANASDPLGHLTSSEMEIEINKLVERLKDHETIPFEGLTDDEHRLLLRFADREDVKEILEKIDYGVSRMEGNSELIAKYE